MWSSTVPALFDWLNLNNFSCHQLLSSSVLIFPPLSLSAAGLRTPLAVPGPYPGAFGMLPHAVGMNGELAGAAGASAYAAGLHNMSPQMSVAAAAAVAAYGRSPMVSRREWLS